MNENGKVQAVWKDVGRFEIRTDSQTWVLVPQVQEGNLERSLAEQIVDKLYNVIASGTCAGMIYMIARLWASTM